MDVLAQRDEGRTELVFGLVGAVGADLEGVIVQIGAALGCYGYECQQVTLSTLLKDLDPVQSGIQIPAAPEFDRLMKSMDAGNWIRERSASLGGGAGILAYWAAATIRSRRDGKASPRTAHIIKSLKHPDEVRVLRSVYGPGFYLIGVHASDERRRQTLQDRGLSAEEAVKVIDRDAGEGNKYGQKTRDAFAMSDVFISQDRSGASTIERFMRLVFGDSLTSPSPDEHAMFMAYAASLRSCDLSRQVGAVVCHPSAGVVATGANDVPCATGGLYWPGESDRRDYVLGHDANERHRRAIAADVAKRVSEALRVSEPERQRAIEDACLGTRLFDITEFGRAVHAEMDALLACARAGVSTVGCSLFSTTFPCHNCAKHIIAAGVMRVVFIEPYSKSQAFDLHGDAIQLDQDQRGPEGRRVVFQAFEGVGPRRYLDVFSLTLGDGRELERKRQGRALAFVPREARPRSPLLPASYLEREAEAASMLTSFMEAPQ